MAKYQITVPDGRSVMVDAANPQDAAEAADTWANQGRSPQMQKAVADAIPIKPGAGGLMRSVVNGLTFNNAPEFDAAINAGETGLTNAVAHLTGQPDAGYGMADAFKAAQMVERNAGQKFSGDHPLLNIGGNLAGSVLNPVNVAAGKFVAGAPGLVPAMVRSAAVSAPIGAAYGAGAAGPGHRLGGAVSGGVTGAVLGAAAPPLLAGGKALIGGATDIASDIATGARNLMHPPDPEAVAGAGDTQAAMGKLFDLARAKGIDIPTLTDPTGMGMTTAEAIGRPGVSSLGALARRSGTTPDLLEAQLRTRAANGPSQILDAFGAASGIHPDEAAGNVEALASRLQKEAGPLYDAALSNPGPVWNTDLAKLAERPAVKKAVDAAGRSMLNAGQDPTAVGLAIDPDTGSFILNADMSKTTAAYPTAQTWDKVKKMVGALVQRDPVTGRVIRSGEVGIQNGDLATASRDLTTALAGDPAHGVPGAIPGYRAALDKAGDYLGMQDAFDRAQNLFLKPGVSAKEFAKTYSALSEPEQKAWLSGMSAKLNDQMQAGRLTPRMLTAPHIEAKVSAVLGDQAGADFMAYVGQVAQLAGTGGRMMPGAGSPTMELLNAASEQDAPGMASLAIKGLRHPIGTAADLWNAGQSRMTSPQVRNELGRLLMQSPEDTAAETFWHSMTPPPMKGGAAPRFPYPLLSGVAATQAAQRK